MKVTAENLELSFWRYWLGGLALFALMVVINPWLSSAGFSFGISDHQSAGTAERVNEIQTAWQAGGVLWLARVSMMIDLLFIGVYSRGAWLGGKLMHGQSGAVLPRLGLAIMISASLFCALDYLETISQIVQIMTMQGSDLLSGVAATVKPPKSVMFVLSVVCIIAAVLIRRISQRSH